MRRLNINKMPIVLVSYLFSCLALVAVLPEIVRADDAAVFGSNKKVGLRAAYSDDKAETLKNINEEAADSLPATARARLTEETSEVTEAPGKNVARTGRFGSAKARELRAVKHQSGKQP